VRKAPLAIVSVALAVAFAGCGADSTAENGLTAKTPTQIVAAARSAAAGAATVHVVGSILAGRTPISLDMELVSGKGGQGRIALEGLSVRLVDIDKAVYINSGEAFYRRFAGAAAARRLQGKWLKGSASGEALGALTSLTDLRTFMRQALSVHGPLRRARDATVAGKMAIGVTDGARGGTLYVAATGTPYPLAIVEHGRTHGELSFNKWNQPVSLEPPADAINIKQLQSR